MDTPVNKEFPINEALLSAGEQPAGRVSHHYGRSVVVAEVTPARSAAAAQALQAPSNADPVAAMGYNAFMYRQSAEFKRAKQQRPHEGRSWDDPTVPGLQAPMPPIKDKSGTSKALAAEAVGPTSQQFSGKIAVGIVIVSGPGALAFTDAEKTKVVAEVQNGLTWLGTQTSGVSYYYDIQNVALDLPDDPGGADQEGYWRIPTMAKLGYAAPIDYVQHIRTQYATDWAYCAFFVKYSQTHFAYAYLGGPYLCMQYANDGWGPDNIDRVFTHESCHIFYALDEYASSGCNCGPSAGLYHVPNYNCDNCNSPYAKIDCLMKANTFSICEWSRGQIGLGPLPIAAAEGAIVVDGGRPYVFAKGSDSNLWVNWWDGSAWHWSNQGLPTGVTIANSMGAITVDGGRPYVFVKGSDGNLWVNWWDGSAWHWSNQGTPKGITLAASMGAIVVDGGRPYVFAKGSDGNLWVNWWDGSAWHWSNQGTPSGVTLADCMGSITIDGGRPYVFVKGSDGNLWVNWWDGSAWHWSNQGTPTGVTLAVSMGSITVDGGRPYVFVKGSDGNLWVNWWDGSAWHWSKQGIPGGVGLTATMGTITVDGGRPYVFAKGSDGNLWVNWWDGSAWHWSNQGLPQGVVLTTSMGTIAVDGGRPYVYVTSSDGSLWCNWWDGSNWHWSLQ